MRTILALLIAVAVLQACAKPAVPPYAREAKKKPQESGVIALHLNATPADRALADNLMNSNCGVDRTVKVLEDQEVAVGEREVGSGTTRKQAKQTSFIGNILGTNEEEGTKSNSATEKTALKEWQIVYECRDKREATR